MDFLGAMFEGIGKTFEAGGKVNVAKMDRQIAYANNKTALTLADGMATNNALATLAQFNGANDFKIIAVALLALILGLVVIFKFGRK